MIGAGGDVRTPKATENDRGVSSSKALPMERGHPASDGSRDPRRDRDSQLQSAIGHRMVMAIILGDVVEGGLLLPVASASTMSSAGGRSTAPNRQPDLRGGGFVVCSFLHCPYDTTRKAFRYLQHST